MKSNPQGTYCISAKPQILNQFVTFDDGLVLLRERLSVVFEETQINAHKQILDKQHDVKMYKKINVRIPCEISTDIATIVYQLCIQPEPHNYQIQVYNCIDDLLDEILRPFYDEILETTSLEFLQNFCLFYLVSRNLHRAIRIGFCYLNRFFVKNSGQYGHQLATVEQKATHYLEKIFLQHEDVFEKLKTCANKADLRMLEVLWEITDFRLKKLSALRTPQTMNGSILDVEQQKVLKKLILLETLQSCHRCMRILGPLVLEWILFVEEELDLMELVNLKWVAQPRNSSTQSI